MKTSMAPKVFYFSCFVYRLSTMIYVEIVEDQHAKRPMGLALHGDLVPASVTSSPRDVFQPSRDPSMLSTSRLVGERVSL